MYHLAGTATRPLRGAFCAQPQQPSWALTNIQKRPRAPHKPEKCRFLKPIKMLVIIRNSGVYRIYRILASKILVITLTNGGLGGANASHCNVFCSLPLCKLFLVFYRGWTRMVISEHVEKHRIFLHDSYFMWLVENLLQVLISMCFAKIWPS